MHLINGKRSQLAMERDAAHNAPFISPVLLREVMVTGLGTGKILYIPPLERVQSHTFSRSGNLSA